MKLSDGYMPTQADIGTTLYLHNGQKEIPVTVVNVTDELIFCRQDYTAERQLFHTFYVEYKDVDCGFKIIKKDA